MPNIVIKKDRQTYTFGLHEDNSVTNWQSIVIPYQGKDYYARIGDDSTPLKVTKGGREYSVQYNPIAFSTFHRELFVKYNTSFEENIFFPKGRYQVRIQAAGSDIFEIYVGQSNYYKVRGWLTSKTVDGVLRSYIYASIDGLVDLRYRNIFKDGTINIERLGD